MRLVVKRASGPSSTASNAGRKKGSKRRSKCTKAVEALATQFKNADPVLGGGIGRLMLESDRGTAYPRAVLSDERVRETMAVARAFVNEPR